MLRRFSVNFTIFSMLLDGLMVFVSLIAMIALRPQLSSLPFIAFLPADVSYPSYIFLVFPLVWVGVLAAFSIYDGKKFFRVVDELTTLTIASLVASISQAGILYLSYRDFSRALFLMIILVSFGLCLAWRLVARVVFRLRKETLNFSRRLLLVGLGPELHKLQTVVSKDLSESLSEVIIYDLKKIREFDFESPQDCPYTVKRVRDLVSEYQITDVIIAFPRGATAWIESISSNLEDLSLGVWVALDFHDLSLSDARVESITGLPLLDLRAPALDDYSRILKRLFDIIVGGLLLVIFTPFILVVALLILAIDGWPVFFLQRRIGENGAPFQIIKFRTMLRDAENLQAQVEQVNDDGKLIHKTPDDPRVTPLGRVLRRLSLDELPQLFNVLEGSMSLVGPRPELPYLVNGYKHWQRRRLTVPPGMTGWWQVHGRSDRVMHLHTEDDIYYIDNYSIWLDLRILVRTAWTVIMGKGSF